MMNTTIATFARKTKCWRMKPPHGKGTGCTGPTPTNARTVRCFPNVPRARISRHIWAEYVEEADHLTNDCMRCGKKPSNRRKGEAWHAMDDLARLGEGVHAGDAYFCCHGSEKIGHLAMEVRWLRDRYLFYQLKTKQKEQISVYGVMNQWCLSSI